VREIRNLDNLPSDLCGGAVSIGNFDGVHRGHAEIVRRAGAQAQKIGGPTVIFTFDPHPVRVLRPEQAPPPLTWTRRKALLLNELGVDALVAYPTDTALLQLTAEQFFERIVIERLAARALVEGANFYFGKNREGDVDRLSALCQTHDVILEIVDPLQHDGGVVSSSLIRQTITTGHVEKAAAMLTRPYRLRGMVTHGAQRGSQLGFPTANLEAIDTLIPGDGVYAGRAYVRGACLPAAINVGPNPTFAEATHKVEIHLVGFDASIYGEPLEVDFLARLRDIQQFAGVDELKAQLAKDAARAVEIGQRKNS
jgi:riboflavin kinase/FMN adenylyltransferase